MKVTPIYGAHLDTSRYSTQHFVLDVEILWFEMVDTTSLHSWTLLFSCDLCTRSVMVNTHVLNLLKS
jgi:hypothetical protein